MTQNPRFPALAASLFTTAFAAESVVPTTKTALFNGKDASGWAAHLKDGALAGGTRSVKDGRILENGKEVNKAAGADLTSGFIGLQSEGGPSEIRQAVIESL